MDSSDGSEGVESVDESVAAVEVGVIVSFGSAAALERTDDLGGALGFLVEDRRTPVSEMMVGGSWFGSA